MRKSMYRDGTEKRCETRKEGTGVDEYIDKYKGVGIMFRPI